MRSLVALAVIVALGAIVAYDSRLTCECLADRSLWYCLQMKRQ